MTVQEFRKILIESQAKLHGLNDLLELIYFDILGRPKDSLDMLDRFEAYLKAFMDKYLQDPEVIRRNIKETAVRKAMKDTGHIN